MKPTTITGGTRLGPLDQVGGGVGLAVGNALVNLLRNIARLGPSALGAAAAVTPTALGVDPFESDPAARDRANGHVFAAQAARAAAEAQMLTNFYDRQSFGATVGFTAVPSGARRGDWWLPPIAPWQDVRPSFKPGSVIGQADLGELLPQIGRNARGSVGQIGDNDLVDTDPRTMWSTGLSPSGRRAGLIGTDGAFPARPLPVREIEVSIKPVVAFGVPAVQIQRRIVTDKPKRQRDRKEVGMRQAGRINAFITATYGRWTEWMDLYEAIRGNLVTEDGRQAAMVYRGRERDLLIAWARGEVTLDLPGAVIDYGVSQASDLAYGLYSGQQQRIFNAMGWDKPVGFEAYSAPVRWLAREAEHDYETLDEDERNGLLRQQALQRSFDPVHWSASELRTWLRRAWYGDEE